jgi:2-C-methyl-D-erythritol 4-phosphate cytidylyltransferase
MGGETPKLLLTLGDRPVLAHTLSAFERASLVEGVVVVASGANLNDCRGVVSQFGFQKVSALVTGGAERQDSVRAGLEAVRGRADVVVVHDGARPYVTPGQIDASVAQIRASGGVVVAVPVKDTVKVAADGRVIETLDRSRLWAAQTPQTFPFDLLWDAHQRARAEGFRGTDEASLVERAGGAVTILEGSCDNIKITTPEDLALGETILRRETRGEMRVGYGYDVHRLAEGRRLVLGGVEIPFGKGLLGHSDADVLCHAVADAVLGAAGLGDIGNLFPNTDPRYAGISSLVLLERVASPSRRPRMRAWGPWEGRRGWRPGRWPWWR